MAGMVATDSVSRIRVTRPGRPERRGADIEDGRGRLRAQAPAELFIRRFARIYTLWSSPLPRSRCLCPTYGRSLTRPFAYSFGTWFYRALIFLVISCPARWSSAYRSATSPASARRRDSVYCSRAATGSTPITKVDTVVFDKTGTLTRGEFSVVKIDAAPAR